jgi:hypothetical protein
MADYLVQSGTKLYKVTPGGVATELTLPSGVTLRAERSRFAQLAKNTVMVGSPTRSLWINEDFTVRTQTLRPPAYAPILSATGSGSLSGSFRVRVSFYVADADDNIILESPLGPPSEASATLASQLLKCQAIPLSGDSLTGLGRRLYRTTTGPGSVYYPWLDLGNNTATDAADDLSDAALILLPAVTTLVNPPGTTPGDSARLITVWKNRLFLCGEEDIDVVHFSEDGSFYQFLDGNDFPVKPLNQNARGLVAFAARRDELGLFKTNVAWKLVGSSPANWDQLKIAEQIGCVSQDSVVIIKDVAYWLGRDGVYSWGPEGLAPITRERVHPWFTTNDVFNREAFENSFAAYNPVLDTYELFLPATGGTAINRWVSYSLARKTWMGPHKTGGFTPSFAFNVDDATDQQIPLVCGTNGTLYAMNSELARDGANTSIDFDVDLAHLHIDVPDDIKHFGEMGARARVESGGVLTITPSVGELDAPAGAPIAFALTEGRLRARILGNGRFARLNINQNTVNVAVRLYGCEVPYHVIGRD